ncbi:TRAP-type C4-dicarboxylate transport system permease small subunit [Chromohalobacter marismortui]|uniref:TRAP transporter small permease protein n=1 Tax=Chromohalobacter marismortui TaxID=42055 RepID=A0A4R7NNF4_9GAMM|nr:MULTISPECIES: TRAP transporter small permease [Chromohalobacter]MCI0509729.1 TRAP transporter small permease [Chromohalobacter sp.]MCI0593308.1 TRAP transporter small permease [Chromohalobacter sp.]TDU21951.1 TRAP-type C4-dicarboxylate transport system permease small subunit [Chromohalobacter marismortui]
MSSLATTSNASITYLRRGLETTCRLAAIIGGLIVAALSLMTVASIAGRWASSLPLIGDTAALGWVGPVTGDYELVEMGTAIAVFLFLPYCHLRGGHVTVDILVMRAPRAVQCFLAFVAEVLFLVVSGVMTWRLYHGLLDKQRYMETSMLLGIPLWWGYVGGIVGFALLTLVCLYRTFNTVSRDTQHHTPTPGDA